jgi:hypothetical protein
MLWEGMGSDKRRGRDRPGKNWNPGEKGQPFAGDPVEPGTDGRRRVQNVDSGVVLRIIPIKEPNWQ